MAVHLTHHLNHCAHQLHTSHFITTHSTVFQTLNTLQRTLCRSHRPFHTLLQTFQYSCTTLCSSRQPFHTRNMHTDSLTHQTPGQGESEQANFGLHDVIGLLRICVQSVFYQTSTQMTQLYCTFSGFTTHFQKLLHIMGHYYILYIRFYYTLSHFITCHNTLVDIIT